MTQGGVLTRRKTLSIIIAFAVCAAIVLAPTPDGLTREGQNALAIFALCFVLWAQAGLLMRINSCSWAGVQTIQPRSKAR